MQRRRMNSKHKNKRKWAIIEPLPPRKNSPMNYRNWKEIQLQLNWRETAAAAAAGAAIISVKIRCIDVFTMTSFSFVFVFFSHLYLQFNRSIVICSMFNGPLMLDFLLFDFFLQTKQTHICYNQSEKKEIYKKWEHIQFGFLCPFASSYSKSYFWKSAKKRKN